MRQFVVEQQQDGTWVALSGPLVRIEADSLLQQHENDGLPIRVRPVGVNES